MQFINKRSLVYRIIVIILSLISSIDLFWILGLEIKQDQTIRGPHQSYIPVVIFAMIFLISAGLYWIKDKNWVKNLQFGLLVISLALTLSSSLTDWPARILSSSANAAFARITEALLIITIILGFVYYNLSNFDQPKRLLLFFLKFIDTMIAVFVTFYLFIMMSVGGNFILLMSSSQAEITMALIIILMVLNIAYGIFIWFDSFGSWWAWLVSILITIEISAFLCISFASTLMFGLILIAFIAILLLGMTYLNNFIKEK